MPDHEPLVVAGVVLGLLAATVLPFAMAAVDLDDRWTPTTPSAVGGKSDTAMSSPAAAGPAPPGTETATPRTPTPGRAVDPAATRPTLTAPDVRCDPSTSTGSREQFPLQMDGRAVTGEDVAVAVIDPSGFDVDDPRLRDRVVATRSFSTGESLRLDNGGNHRHGTESAATIARLAPAADLHLANFRTAHDFTAAVEWAVDQEVDVIVAPVSFYAKPNDGSAPVSKAVTAASDREIPVVVPVGNVATQHWEGTYRGGPWLRFGANDTRLYLQGSDEPVQLWLWWNRSDDAARHDFRVVLYRDHGDTAERIATSQDYPRGPVGTNQVLFERIRTNNVLSEQIANGTYFVRVRGPVDAVHRVELVATAHPLASPVSRGSLAAPATARGSVIAVGAADPTTGRALPTSAWGPTNDGRPGIDLLAPGAAVGPDGTTVRGTSAAAAYTGGVVALMLAVRPGLTPAQAEAVLEATASPAEGAGGALQTGHGLVDPAAALACVSDAGADAGDGS